MGVLFDGDVADSGTDVFGGGNVLYVAFHTITPGALTNPVEASDPDHVLRLGWFSLGDNFDAGDGTARDYWREVVWLNFLDTLWTPLPTGDSSGGLTVVASRIRWRLMDGATGHLHVYGA